MILDHHQAQECQTAAALGRGSSRRMRALLLLAAWAVLAIGAAGLGAESGEVLTDLLDRASSESVGSEESCEVGASISMCPRASEIDRLKGARSGTFSDFFLHSMTPRASRAAWKRF